MIPAKFEYIKASSVDEATELLAQHGFEARLLAGGHSLLPAMKLRLDTPGVLIDIGSIDELNSLSEEGDEIVVGANCTHAQIAASELVNSKLPVLAQTAAVIGDVQVRNRGTIGGNLAHADPAADYPATVLACEAQIAVAGKNGSRTIAAADFFQGMYSTALEEGEMITAVRFPKIAAGNYQKFAQSASRFAVVGVATVKADSGIRVGITGVADSPYRATAVEQAYDGSSAAAEHAVDDVEVMADHFADAEYRAHLAKVLTKRGLEAL